MKMKKFFALLLSLSMVLSLAACGSKGNSNDSQTDGETASDLHLGYDINTGENHYGPYYDEWSDKTDEELFEEALKEDTTINVYATSSKMMKVEESFEEAYPGLDLVVFDLDNDEVLSKAKIEHDTGHITADVLQTKDVNGNVQPVKSDERTRRIDGTAALLDAYVVYCNKRDEFESLI